MKNCVGSKNEEVKKKGYEGFDRRGPSGDRFLDRCVASKTNRHGTAPRKSVHKPAQERTPAGEQAPLSETVRRLFTHTPPHT